MMISEKRLRILFLAVLLSSTAIFSQSNTISDTTKLLVKHPKLEAFTQSRLYQITHAPVPLAAMSLVVKHRDDRYRSLRNQFAPHFAYGFDDYLQYTPAALMLGLKAFGVENRNGWGRMLTSDAFSVILGVSLINSMKYSTRVLRPDGTTYNSFPSGHTAVAFMTATMLHKEYGTTRSPWYSIAGYTMALGTGVSRQLKNRHWVSDVLMGAAIGIFSTEMGYFLADLIFKERQIIRPYKNYRLSALDHAPSFMGLSIGVAFMLDSDKTQDGRSIDIAEGNSAFVEGAWFWNRHFGIGGRIGITGLRLTVDDVLVDEAMDVLSFQVGPYFSHRISEHWSVGASLLGGYSSVPAYKNGFLHKQRHHDFIWGAGASISYLPTRYLGLRGLVNYNYIPAIRAEQLIGCQTLTVGGSVNLMF